MIGVVAALPRTGVPTARNATSEFRTISEIRLCFTPRYQLFKRNRPGAPPAYYPQATGPKNDGMSIAALVCGISGLATLVLCGIGIVPAILGVIFGIIGKKKVEESGGALQGRGMALAGAICGAVAIGLFLIWLVLVLLGAFNSDSSSY